MDFLRKIPEEHILVRTWDSNYPELPDVEYPSATYPPLENYKLGPEDFFWTKLEGEYVYVPRVYDPNRDESWFNPQLGIYCKHLSRFLPGQPHQKVGEKLVSPTGDPIPYRVCISTPNAKTNYWLPLNEVEKVVFKPGSVATVVLTPEPYLLPISNDLMSKIVQVVPTSEEPIHIRLPHGEVQHYVINGKNDPNLVPLRGDLAYRNFYNWEPERIIDLAQRDRVYVSVEDNYFINLLNETVPWIRSTLHSTQLYSCLSLIVKRGLAAEVIPWLRQFSPIDGNLIGYYHFYSPSQEAPSTLLSFPSISDLRVKVSYKELPYLLFKDEASGEQIWIVYKGPAINNPEFLLEKLLNRPESEIVGCKGMIAHTLRTLAWLRRKKAPLELALKAWEELIQYLEPAQLEHVQMQNLIIFEKVWKKLTQEAPTL